MWKKIEEPYNPNPIQPNQNINLNSINQHKK